MKFKQYDRPPTVEYGSRRCTICGKVMPSLRPCKCSVKIRLSGDNETIHNLIAELGKHTSLFIPDNEFQWNERLGEYYCTVYAMAIDPEYEMA